MDDVSDVVTTYATARMPDGRWALRIELLGFEDKDAALEFSELLRDHIRAECESYETVFEAKSSKELN